MFTSSKNSIGDSNYMILSIFVLSSSPFCNFRQKLKEGLYRDMERQQSKRDTGSTAIFNTYNLQQQLELEKALRKEENRLENQTW